MYVSFKGDDVFLKRFISMIFAVFLLLTCVLTGAPAVSAAQKAETSRAIAIVFDNSGSMYLDGNQAWCRATYAMEVFASMLNEGDTLQIYPMNHIEVDGVKYTRAKPLTINDASESYKIRNILSCWEETGNGTPIETIDDAASGLKKVKADEKYMIVLTDGDYFHLGYSALTVDQTIIELTNRFNKYASKDMTVMYLGIGEKAALPTNKESEYFTKKKADDSADILSTLTVLCNRIFGRDTLPSNHVSGKKIDFDISMKKLIVFVQGEDVSNLRVTGASGAVGTLVSETTTSFSNLGTNEHQNSKYGPRYTPVPDESLQGMMVTYEDCAAGNYTIDFSGKATSIEVYYEPDADLDFIFTDANGNNVDPTALYEGEYKVSYGMKDSKTGKLIESDLLGTPKYSGSYTVNDKRETFNETGYSGEIPINLKMGDTFEADLTVTYLSGYTITKNSSDFFGLDRIVIVPKPAGTLKLEITGGDELYSLQHIETGSPYIAKIYYENELLTGKKLEAVGLTWLTETTNAQIEPEFADDHYKLWLRHKNPDNPTSTPCGECTVVITAHYTPEATSEATCDANIAYNIDADFAPLVMNVSIPEDYIVISKLEESRPAVVSLKLGNTPLTPEQFAAVDFDVKCVGVDYTVTPMPEESAYLIKLNPTEGVAQGDYTIDISAKYTDDIGRTTEKADSVDITLSNMPLWLKWLIVLLVLILLITIILLILHIKVLPTHAHVKKRNSTINFDGEDVIKASSIDAHIRKGDMRLQIRYAGATAGVSMDVKPGKESYLRKPQVKRSAEVRSNSVKKVGTAIVQDVTIGSVRYALNEETNRLERVPKSDKPFELKNGMRITLSGTMISAGIPKSFTATTKLDFKKK